MKRKYLSLILIFIILFGIRIKGVEATLTWYECQNYQLKSSGSGQKVDKKSSKCTCGRISPSDYSTCYSQKTCYTKSAAGIIYEYNASLQAVGTVKYSTTKLTDYSACKSRAATRCSDVPVGVCNAVGCEKSGNSCQDKSQSCKLSVSSGSTVAAGQTIQLSVTASGCSNSNWTVTSSNKSALSCSITVNGTTSATVKCTASSSSTGATSTVTISHSGASSSRSISINRLAPSTGCYKCSVTYTYIEKDQVLPSVCEAKPDTSYTYSGGKCVKRPGSSPTPVPTPDPDPVSETINDYRYAKTGAGYQGDTIYCGDKLYITTCDDTYCNVTTINGNNVTTTTKAYKDKLSITDTTSSCENMIRYVKQKDFYYTNADLTEGKTDINCGAEVKFTKSPGDACNSKSCEVSYDSKTIYLDRNLIVSVKPSCTATCESSTNYKNLTGQNNIKVCYVRKDSSFVEQDLKVTDVTCADGYNKSYNLITDSDTCKDVTTDGAVCSKTYAFNCALGARPSVSSSGGVAGSNGKGIVTFTATDNGTDGLKGYYMSNGTAPTVTSEWKAFTNGYKVTESLSAGTYFFWAMSNSNRISYANMSRVHDTEPTTTLALLDIKSGDGSETYTYSAINDGSELAINEKDIKYVRLSNALKNDSVIAAFDSYRTAYELTVTSDKIAVYATLTSNDSSYVPGYEPRTVSLDYGRNVILLKIVNNDGRERTYTIIANRVDDRDSNNVLKSLTVSAGKISFDSYVSDYTIEVPSSTKEVTIGGVLESAKASFVEGYEPRTVALNNDITSAVIKTISEAGISRSYVLTFVKTNAVDDKSINNSVYLSSLSIPGTALEFDRESYSYSVSVDYTITELPVYAFAESENATVVITGNQNFKVGPNLVQVEVRNGSKTKIYTIYVNRKEDGLDVASDTKLSTLTIKDYKLNFDPNVLDYTVKIKREKTLVITATPYSNRSEIYMFGNNDLTGFSTVRIKVIAENGETNLYSIDIQKDAFNKTLELILSIGAGVIIIAAGIIIVVKRNNKKKKEYLEV